MKSESQAHGFLFEEQIKKNINKYLDLVTIKYTNKWDIPPVSVKSFKFDINKKNNRIYFGSIENMYKINDGFFLALIGYKQVKDKKQVVFSDFIFIPVSKLDNIRGNLKLSDIKELSSKLKSFKEGFHNEAREWYKTILPEYALKTKFQINFKVDSKKQRRIQCSLNVEELYQYLNIDIDPINKLRIKDINSLSRVRNIS